MRPRPKSPVKPVQASRKDAPKDTPKSPVKPEETLDPDAELAKLELELEKVNRYPEETSGWDHGLQYHWKPIGFCENR
jgi:hypothetical protein